MKNPNFNNENYILNSLFNDKVLTEFFPKARDSAYMRAIHIQQELLDNMELEINLSDFKIHKEVNAANVYDPTSKTYEIKNFEIPLADKKKFIDKYGAIYGKKIPIMDTFYHRDIFDASYMFHIGEYIALDNVYLVRTRHQSTLILFDKNLMSEDEYNQFIVDNTKCMLTTELPSTIYALRSKLSAVVENKVIQGVSNYFIKFTGNAINDNMKCYHEDNVDDTQYDLYISKGNNNKLYTSCIANLYTKRDNEIKWSVSKSFLDHITNNNTVRGIYLIAKPRRRKTIQYKYNAGNLPVVYTEYMNNPVSSQNIKLYKFHKGTNRKLNRIKNNLETNIIFPDIFNLDVLNDAGDVLIEVYESSIVDTGQKFVNHIDDIYKSIDKTDYASKVLNNEWEELKTYKPKMIQYGHEDYMKSEYAEDGDLRGYLYSKLYELIDSDPQIYNELLKFVNEEVDRKCITKSYTFKELNIRPETLVTDNSEAAKLNNDKITQFKLNDETGLIKHAVIKYRCEEYPNPCLVYFMGQLIVPTMVYPVGKEVWVYVPVLENKPLNYMTEYQPHVVSDELNPKIFNMMFDIAVINNPALLTQNNFIIDGVTYEVTEEDRLRYNHINAIDQVIIDIFPHTQIDKVNEQEVIFTSKDAKVKLFDGKVNKLSLADLVFYDGDSGEILDLGNFDITISALKVKLKNPLGESASEFLINDKSEIRYLITLLNKIYNTKDNEPIILSEGNVNLPLNNINNTNLYKYTSMISGKNITVSINNPTLIGKKILLSDRGNQLKMYIEEIDNSSYGYYDNIMVSNQHDRFEVYGRYRSPYEALKKIVPYPYFNTNFGFITKAEDGYWISDVLNQIKLHDKIGGKIEYGNKGLSEDIKSIIVHLPILSKRNLSTNLYKNLKYDKLDKNYLIGDNYDKINDEGNLIMSEYAFILDKTNRNYIHEPLDVPLEYELEPGNRLVDYSPGELFYGVRAVPFMLRYNDSYNFNSCKIFCNKELVKYTIQLFKKIYLLTFYNYYNSQSDDPAFLNVINKRKNYDTWLYNNVGEFIWSLVYGSNYKNHIIENTIGIEDKILNKYYSNRNGDKFKQAIMTAFELESEAFKLGIDPHEDDSFKIYTNIPDKPFKIGFLTNVKTKVSHYGGE